LPFECNLQRYNTGEVFGEVCVGLGEALVGNEPGAALSFTASKTAGYPAKVRSLPSKPVSHHPNAGVATIIARSDSNGEDLEGFAGAVGGAVQPESSQIACNRLVSALAAAVK
jgi:hypothetical protein